MKSLLNTVSFILILLGFAFGCGTQTPPIEPPEPPTPPVVSEDPNLLYNGIKLPGTWPPVRSYTSDLENGMSPFYLVNKPDTINIAVGRQLFVDNFLIENTNLTRKFHYPEYHPSNPILTADKDWEKIGTAGATFTAPFSDGVWYDEKEGKFKMWYMAGGGAYAVNSAGITCYAESADGITWTKPMLNIVGGTNIVDYNSERDASVVWIDKQETNLSKRYKMFLVARVDGKWLYHYKTSADGKLWRQSSVSKPLADRSTVYKNPFRNNWVFSMRHNVRVSDTKLVRARDYNENTDPDLGTQKAEALLSSFWFGPWSNELRHPRFPNVSPAIYNHDATPYESIMLGFFNVWQGPENDVAAATGEIKRNQILIGYSRDGYSWFREDMNPFLPVNETAGAWNYGNLQSVVGTPLIVNDKLYFYLSGRRFNQSGREITTTGLATLRRDGFASMQTQASGTLTTSILKFKGEYFFVNAKVNGNLKVEVLDEKGIIVSGYSKDDCIAFTGDNTKAAVKWKNNQTLKSLAEKKIKLKFYLENGELYSFWISPTADGKSGGYTGGGGAGFNDSGKDI